MCVYFFFVTSDKTNESKSAKVPRDHERYNPTLAIPSSWKTHGPHGKVLLVLKNLTQASSFLEALFQHFNECIYSFLYLLISFNDRFKQRVK